MDAQNNYTERTDALDDIDRVEELRSELNTTLDRLSNYMESLDKDDPLYDHIYASLEEVDDKDDEPVPEVISRSVVMDGTPGPTTQDIINNTIRRIRTDPWLKEW